ncbi:hypothetical protein [Buttiauxella ferragutiae]|uniref:hypothetical protein n=1 Tax=Buttiauxella ferragutiae TaxID=82989 RepID=UPI001E45A619|nr:hypothetical protein [Buttiauxella ferragutiae]
MAFPFILRETKDSLLKYSATNVPPIFVKDKRRKETDDIPLRRSDKQQRHPTKAAKMVDDAAAYSPYKNPFTDSSSLNQNGSHDACKRTTKVHYRCSSSSNSEYNSAI